MATKDKGFERYLRVKQENAKARGYEIANEEAFFARVIRIARNGNNSCDQYAIKVPEDILSAQGVVIDIVLPSGEFVSIDVTKGIKVIEAHNENGIRLRIDRFGDVTE